VRAYWSLLSARFRMLLQYRAAALAGLGTQLFWGIIRMMVFEAFYRSTDAAQPMSLPDIITYVWLTQAMLHLVPFRVDVELVSMFRDGSIVYELARPLDLYWTLYSRSLAIRTAPTLLRAVPMVSLAALFLGLQLPPSWASFGAFVASLGGAVLLTTAVSTLTNVTAMWTLSAQGVSTMMSVMVMLLAGSYVPLPLFPSWAQGVLQFLPFRGILDTPFRLWMGHIPPAETAGLVLHQLAWTAAIVLVGRLVVRRGTRRLVVQGG